jgi:hypothetical protein
MNKNAIGNGLFMSKVICLVLVLVLGTSLFAAGALTESGCGDKCCCCRNTMDMHHSKGKQITFSAGLCDGDPMIPCHLETGQSSELPDFILSSVRGIQPNTIASASAYTGSFSDRHHSKAIGHYQFLPKNSQIAPIYLQNLFLLI